MAVGSGIAAQFGYKTEASWGTGVTVDKFLELVNEGVANDGGARYESRGIRAGRLTKHRAARGVAHIGGPIVIELPNVSVAPLLMHMFGAVSTSGAGPYTHTYTPGDLRTQSFTAQIGRPSNDGTVQPFTWAGAKIPSWQMACQVGSYVTLTLDVTAKSETTATSLAVASYAAGYTPFTFVQGSLTVAGSSVAVNGFTLSGNNGLKSDRQGPGAAAIREQVQTALRDYSGVITAEFEGLTQYNRFINATQVAAVFTFSNGTDSLTITTNVEFTGESPKVEGPAELIQPLPFSVLHATADASAITAVLVNTDSSAA